MRKKLTAIAAAAILAAHTTTADACTGITLKAKDGSTIVARTIEWGGTNLNSKYVVVPRGHSQRAFVPGGKKEGMELVAKYGYVGLSVEMEEFVAEGINEAGLSAGLFYFPAYGQYEDYSPQHNDSSVGDLQLVAWMLGNFKTVDEVKQALGGIHVITIDPRASTAHWRIADPSGNQAVLEITGGKAHFYHNKLGVLTNSPGFEWHTTNLNNYVNLFPGTAEPQKLGGTQLASFGAGSGFLGIPGDVTPPSRFVRAAFFQATAPQLPTAGGTVRQCFQILNNFDIPIGTEFAEGEVPAGIPSATQWTSATDMAGRKIYYRTMANSAIRCIDLNTIRFDKVKYQAAPLDNVTEQPITTLKIK